MRRRFPRHARLRSGREIRRVLRSGRRASSGPVEGFAAASPCLGPRVAVIVPRFGHSAAERNRVRRRLREIARLEWLPAAAAGPPLDLVLRARPAAYETGFGGLRAALRDIFELLCCES